MTSVLLPTLPVWCEPIAWRKSDWDPRSALSTVLVQFCMTSLSSSATSAMMSIPCTKHHMQCREVDKRHDNTHSNDPFARDTRNSPPHHRTSFWSKKNKICESGSLPLLSPTRQPWFVHNPRIFVFVSLQLFVHCSSQSGTAPATMFAHENTPKTIHMQRQPCNKWHKARSQPSICAAPLSYRLTDTTGDELEQK